MTTGWLCPKCGSGVAPSVERCPCAQVTLSGAVGMPPISIGRMADGADLDAVRANNAEMARTCACRKENGGDGNCGCMLVGFHGAGN